MMQTHTAGGIASNVTPNQDVLISGGGTRIASEQFVTYGGVIPSLGDILFKGSSVNQSGSLGWIFSNYFSQIAANSIDNIVFDGSNVVKVEFRDLNTGTALSVGNDIGITSTSQIRIKNLYYDPRLNLTWTVYASKAVDPFNATNNYCHFQVIDQIPQDSQPWETIVAGAGSNPTPTLNSLMLTSRKLVF